MQSIGLRWLYRFFYRLYLVIGEGQPFPLLDTVPARVPSAAFAIDELNVAADFLRAHHAGLPWGSEEDAGSRWVMYYAIRRAT